MFGLAKSRGLWLFAFSSQGSIDYSFQDTRLQGALDFYKEGQQLVQEANYSEACNAFMSGIFSGRKTVEKLQESPNEDESVKALEWLVSSYIQCAEARIKLEDWQKARSDSRAACLYSQNVDLRALLCMLSVCENTNDLLGQLSTLKSIRPLLESEDEIECVLGVDLSLEDVKERIDRVEKMLEEKFKNS